MTLIYFKKENGAPTYALPDIIKLSSAITSELCTSAPYKLVISYSDTCSIVKE
jgi:hypothetical protein